MINLRDTLREMEYMLGRPLTTLESRIARFSYYVGMSNGITRVVNTEMDSLTEEDDNGVSNTSKDR